MADVVISSGRCFQVNEGENILEAALRHGVVLEHGCRNGRCGTCRARLVAGTAAIQHHEFGLDVADASAGWILTCVRAAVSDITLEVDDLTGVHIHAPRTLPCRIQSLERLSQDVVRVMLRLPPDARFSYHPGQYIDVIGPGGLKRSYSIANAPQPSGQLELHIRHVDGGAMSSYWFGDAKVNDLLRFRGPLGTCFLRDVADRDLILLATGTGIAPIKAMLEGLAGAAAGSGPASVSLYWGGRAPQDLYWDPGDLVSKRYYIPVLSRADTDWAGKRGYVQDAVLEKGRDLSNALVYACGSDAMIHGARSALVGAGLEARRFRSDAFVSSGES